MLSYSWPGNVRELRNSIERAIILEDGRILGSDNLNLSIIHETGSTTVKTTIFSEDRETPNHNGHLQAIANNSGELQITLPTDGISFEELEKNILQLALEKHAGNQTKAARYLQLSRDTLRYRMKKFDLQ